MLGSAWLTIRQAQEALAQGRLEEAHRLLAQPEARGHKAASPLYGEIARAFVQRGRQHLEHNHPAAAWQDLRRAEQLGGMDTAAAELRQALVRLAMAEAHKLLEAGEPARAAQAVAVVNQVPNPPA